MFLAAGAVALTPAAVAQARVPGVTVLRTRVANVAGEVAEGSRLALVRQARGFDPLAVAVQAQGRTLGYVPPIKAGTLAALMDAGVAAEARVVQATPLEIEITVAV